MRARREMGNPQTLIPHPFSLHSLSQCAHLFEQSGILGETSDFGLQLHHSWRHHRCTVTVAIHIFYNSLFGTDVIVLSFLLLLRLTLQEDPLIIL